MPKNIFISYRREDNKYQALRIYDAFQKTNVSAFYTPIRSRWGVILERS